MSRKKTRRYHSAFSSKKLDGGPIVDWLGTDGEPDYFLDSGETDSWVSPQPHTQHKLKQLCSQVEESVVLALGASRDPVLRDALVVAVVPVRGAALLELRIEIDEPIHDAQGTTVGDVHRRLNRAKGYLRSEIASGIHRKRCPDVCFVVGYRSQTDWEETHG